MTVSLTLRQKAFLDDLEEPAEVGDWMAERRIMGHTRLTVKNGRQMTFKDESLEAAIRYLKAKTF